MLLLKARNSLKISLAESTFNSFLTSYLAFDISIQYLITMYSSIFFYYRYFDYCLLHIILETMIFKKIIHFKLLKCIFQTHNQDSGLRFFFSKKYVVCHLRGLLNESFIFPGFFCCCLEDRLYSFFGLSFRDGKQQCIERCYHLAC